MEYESFLIKHKKTKTYLSWLVSMMAVHDLATRGSRASAAMALTRFNQNSPISASEGLTLHVLKYLEKMTGFWTVYDSDFFYTDCRNSYPQKQGPDYHVDRSVQERCNSSALAVELHLFCSKPFIDVQSVSCLLMTW